MTAIARFTDSREDSLALASAVLLLYLRAADMRRLDVAEHLLQALEELAQTEPCCQTILEQAYARIVRLPRPDA